MSTSRRRSPELSSLATAGINPSSANPSTSSSTSTPMTLKRMDVARERYPFCIVWTPIPLITWVLPFVGHMGICDSDGIIHDFGGNYFIGEDAMLFGDPVKYWDISHLVLPQKKTAGRLASVATAQAASNGHREMIPTSAVVAAPTKDTLALRSNASAAQDGDQTALSTFSSLYGVDLVTAVRNYDDAVKGTADFFRASQRYSFFTNNCHSFVACVMESAVSGKQTSTWNMVKLAWCLFIYGKYISVGRFMKAHLPFLVICAVALSLSLGLTLGRKK